MNALHDKSVDALTSVLPQGFEAAAQRRPAASLRDDHVAGPRNQRQWLRQSSRESCT
jgi:hypothetical protein